MVALTIAIVIQQARGQATNGTAVNSTSNATAAANRTVWQVPDRYLNSTLPEMNIFEEILIENLLNMTQIKQITNSTSNYTEYLRNLTERYVKGEIDEDSDAFKKLEDLANDAGFRCENHQVVTDDGYILGIWRIPGKLADGPNQNKSVVLLQHGMNSDMMQWIFNARDIAPAVVLAKEGYDVWLGNNRGTRYSDRHVSLKNTDKHFWNFTWEEMGTKDTPKVIDYILKLTNQTKLSFIGHS